MTFTYIDGIFLGILLLLTLIGVFRGFLKTVLSFCGNLVKLIISFFLSKPIATLISNWTRADDNLRARFFDWASGLSDKFNINLVGMNQTELTNHINTALSDASFPRILRGVFSSIFNITPQNIANHQSITIADLVSISLAQFTLIAICFVAIFVLLFILIFVLKRISKKVFERNRFLFKTDRILGAVIGLLQGLFVALVLLSIVSIFKNSEAFSGFFTTLDKSAVTKPLSEFIFRLIDNYFDFNGFLIKTLNK